MVRCHTTTGFEDTAGYDIRFNRYCEFVSVASTSVESATPFRAKLLGCCVRHHLHGAWVSIPSRPRVHLPNAAMIPVDGISWRDAAMFVNWLNNGKQAALDSLMHGAYDVNTFGTNPDGTFTDQLTHSPGARFWIPTFDELLKSFHYDPNKFGQGQGGWWQQPNGTDTPLISGPPGLWTNQRHGVRFILLAIRRSQPVTSLLGLIHRHSRLGVCSTRAGEPRSGREQSWNVTMQRAV